MILHFTVGTATTYIWIRLSAGVLALEFDTGLVIGTFVMSGTFCVTSSSGVSQEIIWTGAVSTVISCNTVGIVTTGSCSAGSHTFELYTFLSLSTITVRVTFATTSLQWISNIIDFTSADRPVILSNFAVSVCSTGFPM